MSMSWPVGLQKYPRFGLECWDKAVNLGLVESVAQLK